MSRNSSKTRASVRLVKRGLLIGFLALFVVTCGPATKPVSLPPTPAPSRPIVKVVYLFNSEACPCERERNAAAEEMLRDVASNNPGPRVPEKVDVAKQPAELQRYQQMTRFGFMPVLLGLDANGRVVKVVEGFFKQAEVEAVLLSVR